VDPAVIPVRASPAAADDPDALDVGRLRALATVARGETGREYLALSDGWRRIRLDIVDGTLAEADWARLQYDLSGFRHLETRLRTVSQLAELRRAGQLEHDLYPAPSGLLRRLEALRVADALQEGASYRDIATALFGEERVRADWRTRSDFLLSRIRRRAAEAKAMLAGGYMALFGR
jgi:hypothetical protein